MNKLFQIKWYRWIWELPQLLLGLVLAEVCKWKDPDHFNAWTYKDSLVYQSNAMRGGISLGAFIIVGFININFATVAHEYGHCRQSKRLGPLYLLLIGLPSILWLLIRRFNYFLTDKRWDYYQFYTEAWADKLGDVNRKNS